MMTEPRRIDVANRIPINKRKVVACIFLSLITCGIYYIYWKYLFVKNTRAIQKKESRCTGEMLCLLLIPFYSLYWWYTRGKLVQDKFAENGLSAHGNRTAYLILGILGLEIVSMAIMQSDFNTLLAQSTQFIEQGNKLQEKNTGLLTNVDLKGKKGKIIYWIFFSILILCCLMTALPAVWTVFTSLKDTNEIYTSTSFFPKQLSWNIFVTRVSDSWNQLKFGRSILNTVYFSLVQWALKLMVCMFAGYTFSKLKPKGSKVVFALILWTMMMPSQMRTVPNYISFLSFPFASKVEFGGIGINLLDTYWPMWLGGAVDAFAIMLFKNAFDSVSDSIVEAAKIDGAGRLKIFFQIMLPLCVPIIIYESIMTLSGAWSNFFGPYLIIQTASKQLLPAKIFLMGNDGTVKRNTYLMGLIIGSIPQLLIFAFFKKHIMGGINVGAVKG